MNIKQFPVKSFTAGRPGGYQPLVIVLHIMEGSMAGTLAHFSNPKNQASAHFGASLRGEIAQYVSVKDTAWHAGRVRSPLVDLPYPASVGPNLYTIGIEMEGKSGQQFPEAQYQAVLELVKELLGQMPDSKLTLRQRVIGHYQINSVDKPNCPGSTFPWARLYADLEAAAPIQGPAVMFEGKVYPAKLIDGTTWTPVRAVSEAAGLRVEYDKATQVTTLRR